MARPEEIRLMARIARLYYVQGARQSDISRRLQIHQSTVSRMLRRAEAAGMIQVEVSAPPGIYPELEQRLEDAFALRQAIVVESSQDEDRLARDLGAAAARFLDSAVRGREVIGISCCSPALVAMANALQPSRGQGGGKVVQICAAQTGPGAASQAAALIQRVAHLLLADAVSLPASGAAVPHGLRAISWGSRSGEAASFFRRLDVALVGIGALETSRMPSGAANLRSAEELRELRVAGAVGDICLQFFDARGVPVEAEASHRASGIRLHDLKNTPCVVGVAGGRRRAAAIGGALRGGWVNSLITDRSAAEALLESGVTVKKSPVSHLEQSRRALSSAALGSGSGISGHSQCHEL